MIQEILIVRDGTLHFGIPTADIGQILRVPEMTPLALSPVEVRGLCAIGGNIVTALDLNRLLGMEKVDLLSPQSRVLSLEGTLGSAALVVSEVVGSVLIESEKIEYLNRSDDPIVAIYQEGEHLVQVVDPVRLVGRVKTLSFSSEAIGEKSEGTQKTIDRTGSQERYLLFRMGSETYALGIDHLREIIGVHHPITPLSGFEEEVVGMMSLRDELIVVIDLRCHYGLKAFQSDKNRILVAQDGNKVIGLMIDEIIDIKPFASEQIEPFKEGGNGAKISGVIYDNNRLVSLIGKTVIEELIHKYDEMILSSESAAEEGRGDMLFEVVVFRLGEGEYAISIEHIVEIIDATSITPVAHAPESVEGVVNIRGQIVTIGSLYRRLGLRPGENSESKIIICETGKGKMGFFVDALSSVVGVHNDELRIESDPQSLYSYVLHFEEGKRLVLLLDLEKLYGKASGE